MEITVELTAGVLQGSVTGPLLWNIVYDDVLKQNWSEGVKAVAFYDDCRI